MLDDPPAARIVAELRSAWAAGLTPGFAHKVAANAQGIADREFALGPGLAEMESERLRHLLASSGALEEMNAMLAERIRAGSLNCPADALTDHLILTTLAKLAVDQPSYPGLIALREP